MQSYKTFHNDPYSIAKYRSDKKLSPAFYPINPSSIVAKSNEEYELQEVNNKLGALKKAIILAEQM